MIAGTAAKAIIRPPRLKYEINKMPQVYDIPDFGEISRTSISFSNIRHQRIVGSLYNAPNPVEGKPVVVYLHGNASNQLEGQYLASFFCPIGINLFCFDFAGCGESEGEYISLGFFESQDTITAIQILNEDFDCQKFALWGRSMGATTAINVAFSSPQILACVSDSAFISINALCYEIGREKRISEKVITNYIPLIKEKIFKKANFSIDDVALDDIISKCKKPIMFIHGKNDTFIDKSNSVQLYESCVSKDKTLHIVNGTHNSDRSEDTILFATEFLAKYLGVDIKFTRTNEAVNQCSNQHFTNADNLINSL